MPLWDPARWIYNEDGTYTRRSSDESGAGEYAYSGMTKAELADELEARGLSKTGNKDELVARLEEDDA
jgi:SAP domain